MSAFSFLAFDLTASTRPKPQDLQEHATALRLVSVHQFFAISQYPNWRPSANNQMPQFSETPSMGQDSTNSISNNWITTTPIQNVSTHPAFNCNGPRHPAQHRIPLPKIIEHSPQGLHMRPHPASTRNASRARSCTRDMRQWSRLKAARRRASGPTGKATRRTRKCLGQAEDTLAERSKAVAQGAIPKGRGFEPHRCHFDVCHSCWFGRFPTPYECRGNCSQACCWIGRTILPAGLEPATYGS